MDGTLFPRFDLSQLKVTAVASIVGVRPMTRDVSRMPAGSLGWMQRSCWEEALDACELKSMGQGT